MTMRISVAAGVSIALLISAVIVAAPGQDRQGLPAPGTERPGQLTRGQVFIENRSPNEAIPVVLVDAGAAPMPVRLAGATPGALPSPIAIRQTAQSWEYRTISVPADVTAQTLTNLLAGPGTEGFEPAGVQMTSGSTALLVLKRPRS